MMELNSRGDDSCDIETGAASVLGLCCPLMLLRGVWFAIDVRGRVLFLGSGLAQT